MVMYPKVLALVLTLLFVLLLFSVGQQYGAEEVTVVLRMDDVLYVEEWDKVEMLENLIKVNEFVKNNNIRMTYGVVPYSMNDGSAISGAAIRELRKIEGPVELAIHGYDHRDDLVKSHSSKEARYSEFLSEAGPISFKTQESFLAKSILFFRSEGFHYKTFVAPQYKYDCTTLAVLDKYGIQNFDWRDHDFVVIEPLFEVDENNYDAKAELFDKAIAQAIETGKPLLIDIHIQHVRTGDEWLGLDLLKHGIEKLKRERAVNFKQLGELTYPEHQCND